MCWFLFAGFYCIWFLDLKRQYHMILVVCKLLMRVSHHDLRFGFKMTRYFIQWQSHTLVRIWSLVKFCKGGVLLKIMFLIWYEKSTGWFAYMANHAPVVKNLFRSRVESYFDSNITSTGVLSNICEALRKYGLFDCRRLRKRWQIRCGLTFM